MSIVSQGGSREREVLTEITRLGLTITPLMRKLDDAVCV
jgi:hypothetical protein